MPISSYEKSLFVTSEGTINLNEEITAIDLIELKKLLNVRPDIKRILKFKLSDELRKNPLPFYDWFESIPHLIGVEFPELNSLFFSRLNSQKNKLSPSVRAKYEMGLAENDFDSFTYTTVIETLKQSIDSEANDNDLYVYAAALLASLKNENKASIQQYDEVLVVLNKMKIKQDDYYFHYNRYISQVCEIILRIEDKPTMLSLISDFITKNIQIIKQIESYPDADDNLKNYFYGILTFFEEIFLRVDAQDDYKKILRIQISILNTITKKDGDEIIENLDISRCRLCMALLDEVNQAGFQLNASRVNELFEEINQILLSVYDDGRKFQIRKKLIPYQNAFAYPYVEWRMHFLCNIVTLDLNRTMGTVNFGLNSHYLLYYRLCGALFQADKSSYKEGRRILDDLSSVFLADGFFLDKVIDHINANILTLRGDANFIIILKQRMQEIEKNLDAKHLLANKKSNTLLELVSKAPEFQVEVAVLIDKMASQFSKLQDAVDNCEKKLAEKDNEIGELKATIKKMQQTNNPQIKPMSNPTLFRKSM